mmetsp:Transcript_513/g.1103  ORF Transcript_513/g.1103 Transcript_513/m.1103 type:complete len:411 (-) Transcript_513:1067-2299(-)
MRIERMCVSLVDLLHLGCLHLGALDLLQWRQVLLSWCLLVLVDGESEFDHAVDAAGELGGVIEGEAGGEERGVEEEPDEVLDGLVGLVRRRLLLELHHDAVLGVDLHRLARHHIRRHAVVTQRLCLHDPLHVCAPSELGGDEDAGRVRDALADDDLLDLVVEDLLHELAERLELLLELLELLLLVLVVLEVQTLLGAAPQLLAVKLLELLDAVLVDGVDHVDDLDALLAERLEEGGVLDGGLGLAGDVEDVFLALLHAIDILLEADLLLAALARVEAQQLSDLDPVGGVLVDAEFEVLGELLVELLVVVLLLGQLGKHLQALLDEVLPDHLQDLVLLQRLPRDVQRQILGIDHTLDEVEPLWDELLAVVHDEDPPDVQLDVVALLARLEEVERRAAGDEQQRLELQLTFD